MKRGQRTEKAERTRERIMEAALTLFTKKGFEETTMRDIAAESSLAVGAAYYHFKNKDELVFAFYAATHTESETQIEQILAEKKKFADRLEAVLRFKLDQLTPYKQFIGVLAHKALDLSHPFSPFSHAAAPYRAQAVGILERIITESQVKVSKLLQPHLATLLWVYQLGITLYWIQDVSPRREKTDALIQQSLKLVTALIRIGNLPLMGPVHKPLVRVLNTIGELPRAARSERIAR